MFLKLIQNRNIEKARVTIEYKEKNEQINKVIDFVQHLDEIENSFFASSEGKLYNLSVNDILYIESVDRKTFGYTVDHVYELGCKLYEIEEKYRLMDYMRISKSCIVNLKKIRSLKPDFGGKILATMDNNEKLYISRQYARVLKEKLGLGGKRQ
ncbi:MAG: LytTR family DNA-binding domain-containing protein [Lachnospiraceae bacterium]